MPMTSGRAVLDGVSVTNMAISESSIDMNGAQITSVGDPTSAQSVATKSYVDNLALARAYRIELLGTDAVALQEAQVLPGSHFVSVSPASGSGPTATFFLSKSDLANEAHVVRVSSQPGSTGEQANLSWPAGSESLILAKTGANFDGSYGLVIL
jgi:hypothetical protein